MSVILCEQDEVLKRQIEQFAEALKTQAHLIGAHGMEMAAIGIGYSIIRVCDSSRRLHAARKRDCIRILERLGHDETLATRHSAIRSLIRLLDPNASAPWREEYRKLSWLHGVAGSQLGFPSGTAGRMWSDGEVATWQALAREQGLWPPPGDWLPDAPVTRRLILEGR